jgi:hypothetical protein
MGNPLKEGQLLLALQAFQKDPNLSLRAAARIYNVPETTLRNRRDGAALQHDFVPESRKLTKSEETAIIQYIIDLDSRAFPPRISDVGDMANLLLA